MPPSTTPPTAEFPTTHWSLILSAQDTPEKRDQALIKLCSAYWFPIYAYLRRQNQSPHDAEDITQGFFLYLLESDFITRPDPAKGRFRNYLIGALRLFQASQHQRNQAEKRGGKAEFLDWASLAPKPSSPPSIESCRTRRKPMKNPGPRPCSPAHLIDSSTSNVPPAKPTPTPC